MLRAPRPVRPRATSFPSGRPIRPSPRSPAPTCPTASPTATIEFVKDQSRQAFLLYLAHYSVHIPLEAKQDMVERYSKRIKPGALQNNATYAAMVASVDESVGRILQALDEMKLADHTAIIFMSDNGGLASAEYKGQTPTSNKPLKAGKGFLYEGGIREPMIVKWPGVTKPGSQCDVPVISTDFYPTMVEMAGVAKDPGNPADGVSIVPLLKQTGIPKQDALFWHYPHYSNQGGRPGAAMRQGDFKIIEWYEDGSVELYNLRDDHRRGAQPCGPHAGQDARYESTPRCMAEGDESGNAQTQSGLRQSQRNPRPGPGHPGTTPHGCTPYHNIRNQLVITNSFIDSCRRCTLSLDEIDGCSINCPS